MWGLMFESPRDVNQTYDFYLYLIIIKLIKLINHSAILKIYCSM